MMREELIAQVVQQVRLGQSQIFRQHQLILEHASRGEPTELASDRLEFLQSLQIIRDGQLNRIYSLQE